MHARTRTDRWLTSLLAALLTLATAAGCEVADLAPVPLEEQDDQAAPSSLVLGDDLEDTFVHAGGWLVSPKLAAPDGATRAAFMIDLRLEQSDAEITIEARGLSDGNAAEWVPAEIVWEEAPYAVARAELGFVADEIQVRVPDGHEGLLASLRYEAVIPAEDDSDAAEPSLLEPGEEQQGLASDLANVGVLSRAVWGARGTRCTSQNSSKYRIAVHHTVTPPTYAGTYAARVRQIQSFHMDGRGYCDVAYHFLVTTDGRMWEGRPVQLLGAHVGGNNTGNVGVAFIGCFQPGACGNMGPTTPPEVMVEGGAKLIRQIASRYGISRSSSTVKGHRDHSGQSTSCPGNNLHARLGALRSYSPPAPPPPPPPAPAGCTEVKRVAGDTRFQTAAKLSQNNFPSAAVVVIASGENNNPDALVAGPLARHSGGPVLLTAATSLPPATKNEILRLGATKAIIVGGTGAVSNGVQNTLVGLGLDVERLSGSTRFQTAARVARRIGAPGGVAFIASGASANLVDGLAAGAAAAALGVPLLLVQHGSVPPATASALSELGVTRTYIAGGPSAVSNAVRQGLPNGVRLWGDTRYQTAVAVSDAARILGAGTHRIHIARGDATVDAVSVGATGRLLLLSGQTILPPATREFLERHASRATLMGGTGALNNDVERAACGALN